MVLPRIGEGPAFDAVARRFRPDGMGGGHSELRVRRDAVRTEVLGMKVDVRRALLACLVVATAAAVLVATGSAKPRDNTVAATFDALPGPGQVTYGENIAYRATLDNKSGTTLTHVIFRQQFPEITRSDATPATTPLPLPNPVDSSCAAWGGTAGTRPITVDGVPKTEWYCDLGQRPANANVTLTIVWNVPVPTAAQASVNCDGCLSSRGRWTVKEGLSDNTNPNDTFGDTTVPATLLAKTGSGEKLRAGGYETASASCGTGENIDPDAAGNLRTTPLGVGNFLTTTICLPTINLSDADKKIGLGYAAKITEASDSRSATVCIADLGVTCPASAADEASFPDDVVHIFRIGLDGVPKNFEITTSATTGFTSVTHDGHPLRLCSFQDAENDEFGCVVKIVPPKGNQKFWIVVAKSPTNGLWGW
jgi:hypothetical protein